MCAPAKNGVTGEDSFAFSTGVYYNIPRVLKMVQKVSRNAHKKPPSFLSPLISVKARELLVAII